MMTTNRPDPKLLDEPYPLTDDQARRFRDDGFIKLKEVLDPEALDFYGREITRLALELDPKKGTSVEEKSTYDRAFIQVINLRRQSELVTEFCRSPRLARLAAELLGVASVKIWFDQALYKEPAGGFTPWHVDQQYWPMDTNQNVTAWIPLQATPLEMGPLCFAKGTHLQAFGREMEISDESERKIAEQIERSGTQQVMEPFDLGEVSFHYGWTLHRAGGNTTDQPRKVHTVVYMDAEMKLIEPQNPNQEKSWHGLSPGSKVGERFSDPLNPVVYDAARAETG